VLALLAVAAALHTADVPATFGHKRIDRASQRSGLRVLLPSTIRTEFKQLYPEGSSSDSAYSLDLGAAPKCHGATACFVAAFFGQAGARVGPGKNVALARGRTGRFNPTSCGASCAAPQIAWKEHGAVYTIQARGATAKGEKKFLVGLANSAIRNGAR
jgi:hypothetical protein